MRKYMGTKNNNNLFFTCSLIEYIGRKIKRTRREVTDLLGQEEIERIYEYADIFHCEPIAKIADEKTDQKRGNRSPWTGGNRENI